MRSASFHVARYFPNGNVLNANLGGVNYVISWDLFQANEELKEGFHWRLGINSVSPMFQAKWGGAEPITLGSNYMDGVDNPVRCGEFMISGSVAWDVQKV
ncbi:hypothetical protein V6N13_029624 [Hibiscus sabdariffa]